MEIKECRNGSDLPGVTFQTPKEFICVEWVVGKFQTTGDLIYSQIVPALYTLVDQAKLRKGDFVRISLVKDVKTI